MLTGDNGILKQAQNARDKTNEAAKNEQLDLAKQEDLINETLNGVEVEQVTDEKPGVLEGTGTDDDPYTINSIEDLVFFSYDVNDGNTYEGQTVKLALSLDFNSTKSYVEPFRTDYADYGYNGELKTLLTTGEGFKPIGTYLNSNTSINDETNTPFMGTFDGDGHEIDGMRIASEEKGKGLFGLIKNATIKNLTIGEDCDINVGVCYGSITGYANTGSTIEGCFNKAKVVSSSANVGGLVGTMADNCLIRNSGNLGSIQANSVVGGILGFNNGQGQIESCYNIGEVKAETTTVGGIVGSNYGTIINCYNTGNITGTGTNIGGIVGLGQGESKVENTYSKGNIKGSTGGGIVGFLESGTIKNSYYLENTINVSYVNTDEGATAITDSELKNAYNLLGSAFKEDSNNINNGYPILSWQ